ncbi:uncharacterized protein EI90DRAFT_3127402 [Cantharellus anzutake]|uniref:uncharacterized protein n=1 Tax=Cantharellus anzutake TaxID=1750568 RepID=UPI0019054312|nr:uncharacterized protein EI90DRAFT_3127402 [Cantharellus anzutake]KAF8326965.1 hypothetical protein EI90DRAFT_3127402 [Cantharellus anzutake]
MTATGRVESVTLGYLALTANQEWYMISDEKSEDAATFTATLYQNGITQSVSFKDNNAPTSRQYLAGLIPRGTILTMSGNAILGTSELTLANATAGSGGPVSMDGKEYETAIWDYDASTQKITPIWSDLPIHRNPVLSVVWDSGLQMICLTPTPERFINTKARHLVILSLVDD